MFGFLDFMIKKTLFYLVFYIKLLINKSISILVSFNIIINIINDGIDNVYYIKYTMDNMKNIIQLITINVKKYNY